MLHRSTLCQSGAGLQEAGRCGIFCFFDRGNLIVLMNGFQKKTQKTPQKEIEKAIKIKQAYENES